MEWDVDLDKFMGKKSYEFDIDLDKFMAPMRGKNDDDNILQAAGYSLVSQTGNMIHTAQDALSHIAKPEHIPMDEWMENRPGIVKGISEFGRNLEKEYQREYSPWSANRIAQGVGGTFPYMAGLGVATVAAARSGNYQMIGQAANQAVRNAGVFGKYTPQMAKAAEVVTPAATVGAIRTVPESGIEWQAAYDQHIDEAKRNGTYVKGETEKDAERISNGVFRDNMALLGSTNLLETLALTSKLPVSKVKSGLAKLLGSASINAGEEMAQQIFPKAEAGKNWSVTDDDVLEAGVIGAIAGGGMAGAGIATDHFMGSDTAVDYHANPAPESSSSDNIESMLAAAAQKYGVDPDLVHAVAFTESTLRPDAVSEAGAQGVMQLMPETAASLGVSDPFDPAQNIDAGVRYLKQLQDMFGGDVNKALAAYNTGMGTVQENGITGDGQKYIDQVMNNYKKSSMAQEEYDYDIPDQKYYTVLDEVSNPNLTNLTETKLNLLARDFQNKYGSPLEITSMKRNGDGSSWHDSGQAIDMVSDILEKDPGARAWLMEQGKKYGLVGLDEYANPSANATGGHIHFSDHGEALKGRSKPSGATNLRDQYETEDEYYSDLVAAKIEDVVNNNNIEEWSFLEEAKASGDKEQVIEKYPDIKEKLEQYRQGKAEETAGKSNASRNAAIRHIKKRGYIDLSAGKAEMFRQDPISKGFTESKAGNMIRFTAPESFIDRPGVKKVMERTQSTDPDQSAKEQSAPLNEQPAPNKPENIVEQSLPPVSGRVGSNERLAEQSARETAAPANKSYGERLLDLVNTHNIPANETLIADLKRNKPAAIKTAERRLKAVGVSATARQNKMPAKEYGQHLVQASMDSGVKFNNKLRDDLLKGKPLAVKVAERRLNDAGINVSPWRNVGQERSAVSNDIKFSFSDRHERDRERMRKLDKDVKNYVPADYQGKSVGVSEGMANHELQSIRQNVEQWIKAGKDLNYIEKYYQSLYNRFKANKSDGMDIEKKKAFMSFLEGAMSYVRNKRANVSRISGINQSIHDVGNGRGNEGSVSADNRGTYGRNNGQRINGNEINQNNHSSRSGFSTPNNNEQIKYSFSDRHERDRQRMKEQQRAAENYVPEGYRGEATGVMEGLTQKEYERIDKDITKRLNEGKSLDEIEKFYQVTYNRIKANKSDGMSKEKKIVHMQFLQGAIGYVRDKRRNVRQLHETDGLSNERDLQGRDGIAIQGDNRRGNDGSGLHGTNNKINGNGHSKKSGFSMPEKTKYSFTDDMIAAQIKESTGVNIQLVPERFVSPSLKRIMRLGEQMGCPVQYFNGPANMHGFHAGGKTFLNRRSSRSIQETFWHETFHWLRNNNGRLYSDLVSEIQKHSPFTKPQIAAYRKTIHLGEMRTDDGRYLKSDDDIIEEMLADKMPTVAGRLGLSKLLAKENPSLYERFVGFIDNLLQKLKDLAANSTELNQARVMEQAFYRMANDMRNAEGKQIFRANPHTKKLVLVRTGRAIGTEKLESEAAVAYSQEKTETPTAKRARELRKKGYNRSQIIDILVDEYKDENFKPDNHVPGFAQHKELTQERLKGIDRLIEKHFGTGISLETLEKQLFQRYNQGKGVNVSLDEKIKTMAYVKGVMWHVRDKYKTNISRSDGDGSQGEIGELLRSPYGRFLNGVDGSRRERTQGSNLKGLNQNVKSNHSETSGFSMPKNDDILYSFSSGNNRETLIGKIRNIFSGGRYVHPVTRQHIVRQLEELGRIKIAFGKLEGDEAVVYKEIENVIRAKRAYDWENLLPKVGKAISRQLGINDKEPMQNYIADWFLTGATNNTSAESIEFARAMRENPQFAERMMETQEMFQHWNSMEAMERGKGMISWAKPKDDARSLLTRTLRGLHDQFIEELGPVKRLVKDIEKRTGKTLSAAGNPYTAFRLFRGHFGKSMVAIEGTELSVKALKNVFPGINFDNFKTLNTILTEAGVLRNKEKMQEFITYAVAKHVKDIHIHNKTAEETMDTPFSEKDCDEIIAAAASKYAQAQKDLVHYSNTLAAILADSGVISRKRYHEMKNGWKNYVPLFRVFEENEEISFGDSTRHMSGSSRDIVNPLESIIKNTYAFIKAAEKNKAKAKLGMVAKMSQVGEYIESVDNARPDDKTTITYLVDGKRVYLKTDPEIVKVINTLGVESSNWFLKAFRLPTQIARATVTILNPEFAIRNLFSDVGDATIYSKYGFTPADFFRGFMHALRKDELYYEFIASGAGQSSAISLDRNYTQATIDNMSKTTREKYLSTSVFRSVLNALQAFGEYSEYGTRIGAYEKARKAEQKKAAAEGRRTDTAGIAEAALESRDLMDFARGGKASRSWNQISMFSNASLQGWDKFFRTFDFSDPHQAKHAKSALLRLFFTAALPALALWMINRDDDRYKEIPEWQKNKHWIIFLGDKIFRIPKGHDVGIQLFSNWVEKGLNAAYAKDPITLKKALRPIADMLPSLMPTAVLPITEAMANYSFFTERPIVPRYQERLPNKMQYDSNTTSLAKFVGEQTDLSPKKIEHVLFGYTGGLGKAIPNTYDYATGKKQLNTTIEELPFARGIMITPYKNAQSVTDYYEAVNEQTKYYNELKTTGKRPEEFDPSLYGRIKAASPVMQNLSKMERAIADNADMPVEMKKQKQVEIQRKRIEIAKKVMGR